MSECEITIISKGNEHTFRQRKGLSFQALAARTAIPIEFDCRKSDCGICIIKVQAGTEQLSPAKEAEQDFLRAMHADADERLACQCRIYGNVRVEVEF
jgi:ferredoxin